jgi:RNA polymerase sigma-70 factor (ECF subfamily)
MSEAEWSGMSGAQGEQGAAFAALLGRVHVALISFVRGVVGRDDDAADVVQDVFVDAVRAARRQLPPFVPPADEAAMRRWLFHAAYCKAISLRRRHGVLAWESLDGTRAEGNHATNTDRQLAAAGGAVGTPAPFEERLVEADALRAALTTLEDEEAACVMLHVVQGCTSVEIGRILQITPDAARKRLSRALQRLRSAYFAEDRHGQQLAPRYERTGKGERVGP